MFYFIGQHGKRKATLGLFHLQLYPSEPTQSNIYTSFPDFLTPNLSTFRLQCAIQIDVLCVLENKDNIDLFKSKDGKPYLEYLLLLLHKRTKDLFLPFPA